MGVSFYTSLYTYIKIRSSHEKSAFKKRNASHVKIVCFKMWKIRNLREKHAPEMNFLLKMLCFAVNSPISIYLKFYFGLEARGNNNNNKLIIYPFSRRGLFCFVFYSPEPQSWIRNLNISKLAYSVVTWSEHVIFEVNYKCVRYVPI